MTDLPIEEQRALAAKMYPHEWARALCTTGMRGQKARAGLRKRAVEEAARDRLRCIGANCGNCAHRLRDPAMLTGHFCDLDSDFHGYTRTTLEALCSRWSPQP
jgi:hypothetical protein